MMTMSTGKGMPRDRLGNWIESQAHQLCIGITCVGVLFRLYSLGTRSLWLDEAIEVSLAREPISHTQAAGLATLYGDLPLLSWLLHFVLKVGSSEAHPHTWFIASHIYGNEVDTIFSTLGQRCRRTSTIIESGALAVKHDCSSSSRAPFDKQIAEEDG
jgi:hypothetical protein